MSKPIDSSTIDIFNDVSDIEEEDIPSNTNVGQKSFPSIPTRIYTLNPEFSLLNNFFIIDIIHKTNTYPMIAFDKLFIALNIVPCYFDVKKEWNPEYVAKNNHNIEHKIMILRQSDAGKFIQNKVCTFIQHN